MSSEIGDSEQPTDATEAFPEANQPEGDEPTETMESAGASASEVASVNLYPGEVVSERYRIEERIGAGGMGVVFRAYDQELDEVLAVKVLQLREGDSESKVSRFKQEIKLARKIVHPNVCRIYDFGSWRDLKFVTMELLHGQTLDALLRQPNGLTLDAKLDLFRGMLAGMRAAHRLQIIHRDLKPQNVMITEEMRPVIMDFGLARDLETSEVTASSEVVGTPSFMAPEHLMGHTVDHRCDIYSLGIMLFQLTTGEKPFTGNTIFEIAQKQLSEEPPRPSSINPEVSPGLEKVVLEMIAREPEERFQSVDEVLAAIQRIPKLSGKKVLIIDDDPVFRSIAEAQLVQAGIEVLTAQNGAEGLEQLLRVQPDLVCLDFRMPGMDGFHVASYIQQLGPERNPPPIFMMTAIQDPQYEKQAARLGIERFFTKPVDGKDLAEAVIERLGRGSSSASAQPPM